MTCGTPACTAAADLRQRPQLQARQLHDDNDWGYNLQPASRPHDAEVRARPQFPMTRYYVGLTSQKVPNRNEEYPSATSSYNTDTSSYTCTNPLFAATLPQASDVPDATATTPPRSTRSCAPSRRAPPAVAGTSSTRTSAASRTSSCSRRPAAATDSARRVRPRPTARRRTRSTPADWVKILGQGPAGYTAHESRGELRLQRASTRT